MKRSINSLKKFLKKRTGYLVNQGYDDFKFFLQPLEKISKVKLKDREVFADLYYLLGDIWDIVDAPLSAIRAYKKALLYEVDDGFKANIYGEIGNRYAELGNKKEAILNLKKALKLNPNGGRILEQLEFEIKDGISKKDAVYMRYPWLLKVSEEIAKGNWKTSLKILKNKTSIDAQLHRMRCYGIADNAEMYFLEVDKLCSRLHSKNKTVILDLADWFYISDNIYNSDLFQKKYIDKLNSIRIGKGL